MRIKTKVFTNILFAKGNLNYSDNAYDISLKI